MLWNEFRIHKTSKFGLFVNEIKPIKFWFTIAKFFLSSWLTNYYCRDMHSNFDYLYWNQQLLVLGAFLIDELQICTAFLFKSIFQPKISINMKNKSGLICPYSVGKRCTITAKMLPVDIFFLLPGSFFCLTCNLYPAIKVF